MLVPFGQNQRRSACPHDLNDVLADGAIARLVLDERLVQRLKLDSLVRRFDAPRAQMTSDERSRSV